MEKNRMYLITGIMASGKSTVAQLMAERFEKAVHLRGDAFRRMIVSGREEMSEDASQEALRQLDLRYAITAQAAKLYYDAGFTVVVQDNFLGEKLPYFLSLLEPLPVETIVLCPSPEVVKKREAARGKTGYVGFSPEVLYQGFIETTPRIGRWVDTSEMTAVETVDWILSEGII